MCAKGRVLDRFDRVFDEKRRIRPHRVRASRVTEQQEETRDDALFDTLDWAGRRIFHKENGITGAVTGWTCVCGVRLCP